MSKNILIVDDNPGNLRYLSELLTEQGYLVRAAPNGTLALTAIEKNLPDLILLDILMPEMDGFEVCRLLKANIKTQNIPVIFISALDEVFDKVRAFNVGGVDYITKPFYVEEVLARVQTHLTLRRLNQKLQVANAELARHIEELQEQNAELDAFAHTVAHDIKNPLGVLYSYAAWLEEEWRTVPPDEVTQSLNIMVDGGQKACNIVDGLLLLASTRKQSQVHTQSLNMGQIVADAQKRLGNLIQHHQAEIVVQGQWPVVSSYAPWVEEVWVNYISNAIKYGGEPPWVEIGATVQADDFVRLWVNDNGSGIPDEKQALLFTEFSRLEEAQIREGHGLGLSIVQRIVSRLGGQVGVESTVGTGSTFWFTLPLAE